MDYLQLAEELDPPLCRLYRLRQETGGENNISKTYTSTFVNNTRRSFNNNKVGHLKVDTSGVVDGVFVGASLADEGRNDASERGRSILGCELERDREMGYQIPKAADLCGLKFAIRR
ncbi:hypothetical protein Plhal304r1_c079g0165501 [Plasmopara halstedii]